ncbi:MAG: serine/threonine protein kinase [Deltaproteobacteria bacterium]|nr:serine/threonine protein kinase [Deltaproteobacteria bacterium]
MGSGPEGIAVGEILDRYRLDRLLGAGATSQVFLATHVQLERRVAVKVLFPRLLMSPDAVKRMLQEARLVNAVRHPNIVEVFDFIESESPIRVALVMEYIEGPSLRTLADFRFSFEQALGMGLQLCAAIQAAHAAGVIHRDLKPENILLTRDPRNEPQAKIPRVKIIDFGIAKLSGSSGKTVAGKMVGTPAYMAPEQIAGHPPASTATDVFAFGEIFFELLAGRPAYAQPSTSEVVRAKLRGQRADLSLPDLEARAVLEPLLGRCLAHLPPDRPTLAEVRERLQSIAPWPEVAGAVARPSLSALGDLSTRPWMDSLDDPEAPSVRAAPPTEISAPRRGDEEISTKLSHEALVDAGVRGERGERARMLDASAPTMIAPAPMRTSVLPPAATTDVPARSSIPAADTLPMSRTRLIDEGSTVVSPLSARMGHALDDDRTPRALDGLAGLDSPSAREANAKWDHAQIAEALSQPLPLRRESSIAGVTPQLPLNRLSEPAPEAAGAVPEIQRSRPAGYRTVIAMAFLLFALAIYVLIKVLRAS